MAASPSDLDQLKEFLTVGPFGGLDPTTNPYYVAPTNFVAGENFVPNHGYGGFVTVMGRNIALAAPLPGPCNGMHVMHRLGLPDVYLFAVDVASDTQYTYGGLYWAELGGTPAPFVLPQDTLLTPGQQTWFADCQSWVFISNGVDRPLKIDTSLNITWWGILPPTVAPNTEIVGPGLLLGTYYYCCTFSNSTQESSQGTISTAVTCTNASASGDQLLLTLSPDPGSVITIYVGSLGEAVYAVDYTVPNPAPAGGLRGLAQAVAMNFNADPFVTQYATASAPVQATAPAGQIVLTAAAPGASGDNIFYYGQGTPGGTGLLPHTPVFMSGGADGNTVKLFLPETLETDDPQVTEVNIYRLGGSLGTWNLIKTLPVGAKEYYDITPDSNVTGQQLIVFRDSPPPFMYIATHQERVWGFGINVEYNPQTNYDIKPDQSVAWWSNLNEPWGFNSAVNNFTCGDNKFSDIAAGLMELGGVLLAVKSRRCYFIYGSTDDDFQPVFAWFVGCDAPLSIATGYGMGFWHSRQGIHMTDGYQKNQISDAQFQQSNVKNILDTLSTQDFASAVGFIYDRQYYFSVPTQDFTLLYDMRDQQWYRLGFSCGQVSYDLESDVPVVAMDNKVVGQVDKWFDSPCDFGGTVTARLTSRISDGGVKYGTKRLERCVVLAPIQSGVCAKVVVTGDPDGATQTSDSQTVNLGDGYQRHEWGVAAGAGGNIDCYTMQVSFCVDGPAIIDTVAVYGWVVRVHEMGGPRTDFPGEESIKP